MNHNVFPLKPFYFIRHGETDWNQRKIIMGSIDIPLNQNGIQQAHHAAEILENKNFDIIIYSPRARAQQTAEIIALKTHKPLIFEKNLTERVWGEMEGKPTSPENTRFDDAYTPLGAETFSTFKKRVVDAVSSLLLNEKIPLMVSHGGVFKALAHSFGYKELESSNCATFFFTPPTTQNASWNLELICGE